MSCGLLHDYRQLGVDLISFVHAISLDDEQYGIRRQNNGCCYQADQCAYTGSDARLQQYLRSAPMIDSQHRDGSHATQSTLPAANKAQRIPTPRPTMAAIWIAIFHEMEVAAGVADSSVAAAAPVITRPISSSCCAT